MTYDQKITHLTNLGTLVRTADFDDASWFNERDPANNYGIINNSGIPGVVPVQDGSMLASGHQSMKFTIAANQGQGNPGQFWMNFSADLATQFGEGEDVWIQWQQRYDSLTATHGKQVIIGSGDQAGCAVAGTPPCYGSCSDLEVVVQGTNERDYPQMYNSCTGSASHGSFDPFEEDIGGGDFKMQNAMPSPFCLHSNPAGCFMYEINEWMTFTVQLTIGARVNGEFEDSHINLWVAREGETAEQVFDWGPYNLTAGAAGSQKFGKVWLVPYNTVETHPEDHVWYANLIIASGAIPTATDEVTKLAMVLR